MKNTGRLRSILELFKRGRSLEGIVALESFVKDWEARSRRGGMKASEARERAARENGKRGGRPRKEPAASIGEEGSDAYSVGGAALVQFPKKPILPPGVKLGSELEARE